MVLEPSQLASCTSEYLSEILQGVGRAALATPCSFSGYSTIHEVQHLVCLQGGGCESHVPVKLLSPLISIWFVSMKTHAEAGPSRIVLLGVL